MTAVPKMGSDSFCPAPCLDCNPDQSVVPWGLLRMVCRGFGPDGNLPSNQLKVCEGLVSGMECLGVGVEVGSRLMFTVSVL